jgi:helicase MOV-10
MSLMERLMLTDEKYEFVDGEYYEEYVTQLKKNYRNHPSIMRFSNENFYNSNLVSCCSEEILNFAKDPKILMFNPEFPMLFHTVHSPSKEVGTSLKNDGEVMVIGFYLNVFLRLGINGNKVTQKDIGIICPYRGQRDLIMEKYQRAHPEIEIGTVDAFQGREKKIIIMSLVRSQTRHVGFLKNEKRLNVSLTRAKALLIIIGNAATLQKCSIWNKFITYCYENKAVVGDIQAVNRQAVADPSKAEKEELPENGVEDEYEE